jgi:hypothetical protein
VILELRVAGGGSYVAMSLTGGNLGREGIVSCEGTREMNTLIVGKSITGLSAFV